MNAHSGSRTTVPASADARSSGWSLSQLWGQDQPLTRSVPIVGTPTHSGSLSSSPPPPCWPVAHVLTLGLALMVTTRDLLQPLLVKENLRSTLPVGMEVRLPLSHTHVRVHVQGESSLTRVTAKLAAAWGAAAPRPVLGDGTGHLALRSDPVLAAHCPEASPSGTRTCHLFPAQRPLLTPDSPHPGLSPGPFLFFLFAEPQDGHLSLLGGV